MRARQLTGAVVAILMRIRPTGRRPRKPRAPMAILSEIITFGIASIVSLVAAFCFAVAWGVSRPDNLRVFGAAVTFACLLNFAMFWVRLTRELDDFASLSSPRPPDRPANDR